MITNAIQELNAKESYKDKFLTFVFKLWKGNLRLVGLLARRQEPNKRTKCTFELLFVFWKMHRELTLLQEMGTRKRQQEEAEHQQQWQHYIPIFFRIWAFVIRFCFLKTSQEASNELNRLEIKKQWRLWVKEEFKKERKS